MSSNLAAQTKENKPFRRSRLRLGGEFIELSRISGQARPAPVDARSNDHWLQHVAIIVSETTRSSTHHPARSACPIGTGTPAVPRAFYFRDPAVLLPVRLALLAIALLASYLPARRASRINLVAMLRE